LAAAGAPSYAAMSFLSCSETHSRTMAFLRGAARSADLEDLHHLVAEVVDHLDGDAA
jgi:hypothetical protein